MGELSGRDAAGRFPMVSMWSFSGGPVAFCLVEGVMRSSKI